MQEIRVNPLDLSPEEQEKSRKQAELVFKKKGLTKGILRRHWVSVLMK